MSALNTFWRMRKYDTKGPIGLEIIVNPTQTIGLRLSAPASLHRVIINTHEATMPGSPTNKAMVLCGIGRAKSLFPASKKAVTSHRTMTAKLIVSHANSFPSFAVSIVNPITLISTKHLKVGAESQQPVVISQCENEI